MKEAMASHLNAPPERNALNAIIGIVTAAAAANTYIGLTLRMNASGLSVRPGSLSYRNGSRPSTMNAGRYVFIHDFILS